MWTLDVPAWELILRAVIIYVFLIALIRISGKRQIGQLAPFDLILLLMLSNAVQDSLIAGDESLVGGMLCALTLVMLNFGVSLLTFRSKKWEALIEGRPQLLVHNGRLYEDVMARAQLTHHELNAALRQAGCEGVQQVRSAILENNGVISVVPLDGGNGK
jgi:uncharacterized membrane protein YcaP (DUF421 family)